MSDDTTGRRPPEPAELQLRKALATMNDLQPPRDDLFVQRVVNRGRAATARRRSVLLRAAAAVVVVGAAGGTWYAASHVLESSGVSASAGSAPEAATDSGAKTGRTPGELAQGNGSNGSVSAPALRDSTTWFEGPATAQTRAFEAIEPTLVSRWPDVFSGAYASDPTNTHLVVALTRPDSALESFVTRAMPSPTDVEFATASHSFAQKDQLAQQVLRDAPSWRSQGVQILGVHQDGRADQVVVLADEGSSPGALVRRYGDLIRVVPSTAVPTGSAPGGSTLPTVQP
jgi:hypothetical protein